MKSKEELECERVNGKCRFEREGLCSETRRYYSGYFVWPPIHSGQSTKELWKEMALLVKCERVRVEMCHSVLQTHAGWRVADLMVYCYSVLCMQLLLSACVSPLLLRGRLWFTEHDSFLSLAFQLPVFHQGCKLLNCTSQTWASPDGTRTVLQLGSVKMQMCITPLRWGSDRHISISKQLQWN